MSAQSLPPLSYLHAFGARSEPVVTLTWALLILSILVCIIMSVAVLLGVWRRRAARGVALAKIPIRRGPSGLAWIGWGVALTTPILIGSFVWTSLVLARTATAPPAARLTVEVTGHQWWWEARYTSNDPQEIFTTANEIHVPVGEPVLLRLRSEDVIHSFWVPTLAGKTDLIPGRVNGAWIEAAEPGVYRGKCAEYCGLQHAHMGFAVIAEPQAAFEAWRAGQLAAAAAPASPLAMAGERVFMTRCAVCHTVRGTSAGGMLGPDLTHLASRTTIAAALLPNTRGHLGGWIGDPQALKPGAAMPAVVLGGPDLQALLVYLEGLK